MAHPGMRPFVLAPGEGRSVENPVGGVTTFKALSDESGGGLTVIEGVSAPGEGPPLHVHREQDEFIYTLDGTFRVRLGDDLVEILAGSFVFIPRNTPHTWQNARRRPRALRRHPHSPRSVEFEEFFLRYADLPPEERGMEAFGRLAVGDEGDGGLGSAARTVTPALIPVVDRPWRPTSPTDVAQVAALLAERELMMRGL